MGIYYVGGIPYSSDELYHHGIKGQKWGIRRYQDKDGKLTELGKERYTSAKEQEKFSKLVSREGLKKREDVYNAASRLESYTPQFMHAVASLRKEAESANKYEKEYKEAEDELAKHVYENKEIYDKWLDKAVDDFISNTYDNKVSPSLRKDIKNAYKFGDLDQGEDSVLETYARHNKKDPRVKRYDDAGNAYIRANKELLQASKHYANEFLGEYSGRPVEQLYPWNTYVLRSDDSLSFRFFGAATKKWK